MRVVFRSWYSLQLTSCDQLAHQDACAPLNALTSIVGELHLVLVEMDAVTEDAEHGTGSHDVGVKTFLPEVSV